MRLLNVLLFICFLSPTSWSQGIDFQAKNWDEAVALAKAENKLIFLDAFTTWCAPCKVMDDYVFTHELGGELHNKNFVNLKMDMEKEIGPLFVSRYGVSAYPSFLYLTWDGTLVHKSHGFQNIEKFVREGNKALEPYRLERALNDRFNEGDRLPDFLYHLTYYRQNKNDMSYYQLVPMYLETQSDWNSRDNLKYIFDFVQDFDSEMFKHMSENKVAYSEIVGASAFNTKFKGFIDDAMENGGEPLTLERREQIYKLAYPGIADQMMTEYKLDYYKDKNQLADYARTSYYYYTTYASDDEEAILQDLPLYEEYLDTSEARAFVREWHGRIAERDNSAMAWLRMARYQLQDGNFDKAKEIAKKAKKLAKLEKLNSAPFKLFLKEIKVAKKSRA